MLRLLKLLLTQYKFPYLSTMNSVFIFLIESQSF